MKNSISITPMLMMIIMLLIMLMQLSTDLYTPSLPSIAADFSSSIKKIQLTLSVFMLGFSLSHLFYGPLSDRIGRRKPLLLGVGVSISGSLVCYLAPDPNILIFGRFIQGFGIGCCNSVGRSLARDVVSSRLLARLGSYVGMVSIVFLAMSPALGGYIESFWGWRANFLFLIVFASALWLLLFACLKETHANPDKSATKFRVMKQNYKRLLLSRTFMGYTLCACFAGAGIIAWLTIAPFLLQEKMGLTSIQFGWLACVMASGIFMSGLINSMSVMRYGIALMVLCGIILMLLAGALLMYFVIIDNVTVSTIMLPVGIFSMGGGFTFINAFAGAFDPFPDIAGTAGALYGFLQDLSAATISMIIAVKHLGSQSDLAIIFMVLALLTWFAWSIQAKKSWGKQDACKSK